MSQNNNQISSRLVYENAKKIMMDANLSVTNVKLTQSDLRLEQQMSTSKTTYIFAILNNNNGPSNTVFPTEVRLTQQDSFVASQLGFFIAKPSGVTDCAFIVHSYPSPVTFSTTGTAAAAETLYNSLLAIMVNNDNVLPVWHLGRHRSVPQSQQQTGAANANNIAQDQIDLSSDGFVPVEPNILLIGSKNSVITMTLPSGLAAVETFQRSIIWFRGLLAQNSTILT